MKTFLIAILNLGVRGEWGGCGVVVLGNSPALIRHVSLALAKFFPSTVQDGTIFVWFRFMFQVIFKLVQICVCTSVLWNRCLRMLCSGGIQKLSSGKSGVVVLGTNAQT